MLKTLNVFVLLLSAIVHSSTTSEAAEKRSQWKVEQREIAGKGPAVLWVNADIASRDLFHGPGGRKHLPRGRFSFVKEDLDGSSPKYVVQDQAGVKWKVKIGVEAKPETVASRLVWAVGYFADENYFLPELKIGDVPQHLHRGRSAFTSDGVVRDVRLKRYLPGEEKIGNWMWSEAPFKGTRELNGLRVIMALINNWDLKDVNNAVYQRERDHVYMVSDLGASFAGTSFAWPARRSRGNLKAYQKSKFIRHDHPESIDFAVPSRPSFFYFFLGPRTYVRRVHLRWIGEDIPRDHAAWTGDLLAQISPKQIRDAFRAAGYTAEQVEEFSEVVERRIADLRSLRQIASREAPHTDHSN